MHLVLHVTALLTLAHASLDGSSVFIREVPSPSLKRSTEHIDAHPHTLPIDLYNSDGRVKRLLLQKNPRLSADIPVTFSSAELNALPRAPKENIAVYQDPNHDAAITVTRDNGRVTVTGKFVHDGDEYSISPGSMTASRASRLTDRGQGVSHTLTRSSFYKQDMRDMIERSVEAKTRGSSLQRRGIGSGVYEVEIDFYMDHTIYDHYLAVYSNHGEAVNGIQRDFTTILNSMDLTYVSIEQENRGWSIRLVPREFKLFSYDESTWTVPNILGDEERDDDFRWGDARDTVVKSYDTLQALIETNTQLRADGLNADHVMLWSRYNFGSYRNYTSSIGVSYVGQVCGNSGISIVEYLGIKSWRAATHELGHNLGSNHDGSIEGRCDSMYDYMMAPTDGIPENKYYSTRFSSCSLDEIYEHIIMKQCLTETDCSRGEFNRQSDNTPGDSMTYDEICELIHRPGVTFYEEFRRRFSCTGIHCIDPVMGADHILTRIPPDGTTCGDDKWCIRGYCEDKSAYEPHYMGNCGTDVGTARTTTPDPYDDPDVCMDRDALFCSRVTDRACNIQEETKNFWCCETCKTLMG